MNQHDVEFSDAALSAAALRGFREEFGCGSEMTLDMARVRSVFLEYGILNIGFCAILEPPLVFEEIVSNWTTSAVDKWENVGVEAVPFTIEHVRRLLASDHYHSTSGQPGLFHPTSKYRLLLAAASKFGWDALSGIYGLQVT